jgi:hypothetical protein
MNKRKILAISGFWGLAKSFSIRSTEEPKFSVKNIGKIIIDMN